MASQPGELRSLRNFICQYNIKCDHIRSDTRRSARAMDAESEDAPSGTNACVTSVF